MFEKWKRRKRKPKNMKTLISREMGISRRHIYVGTQRLEFVKEKDFHEFLVADMTDKEKWIENVQECDHFALYLLAAAKKWFIKKFGKNMAVGIVWRAGTASLRGHAFNFIVNEELKIRYYEPQSDREIFPVGQKLFVYI
jgi:hypothetical protein